MKILLPALAFFCGTVAVCAQHPIPAPEKGNGWIAFDFETGDLQGWRIVSGANGHPIAGNARLRNANRAMNKEGRFYLGTLEMKQGGKPNDKQTCIVESPVFRLEGPTIRLAVSGGTSSSTYIALCTLDGKELRKAHGRNSELFFTHTWEIPDLVGESVFVRLVDQNQGPWGHIVVDAISARGTLLPEQTKKRFAHLPTPRDPNRPLSPEAAIATFTLPKGFTIELVASEEHGLINPIDIAFDDAGRLWTQTARMYPLDPVTGINFGKAMKMMRDQAAIEKNPAFARVKRLYQLKDKGSDQILILDDPTRTADKPLRIWADGLTIPQSIIPYKNGAYVAHGSELFYLEDRDGNGQSDTVTPVLSGFGFFDTHTMAHGLVRAPGGWFHFSHGLINSGDVTVVATGERKRIEFCLNARFSNDHRTLEIINVGLQNIWGYQQRSNGQWYGTEANDIGYSVIPMEIQSGFRGVSNPMIRPYQPLLPAPHSFRVGGTGISGLAFSEDGTHSFPQPWHEVALLANPITRKINAVRTSRNSDGSIDGEHLSDFLTSSDPWFRPVTIEFGPDGSLYIADWCNKIISHNEVDTAHPDRDKKHGRIWRVRHESQPVREIPNLIETAETKLVQHLSAPILWEKRAAWHQLVDRKAVNQIPALHALLQSTNTDVTTRIHALWALEGLKGFDQTVLQNLLADDDRDLRREAVRSLTGFQLTGAQVAALIAPLAEDSDATVRAQVLRTLTEIEQADPEVIDLLVRACKPALGGNELGGSYERSFERYLARMALEQYRESFRAYVKSDRINQHPPGNLLWAIQVLPTEEREALFINLWKKAASERIDKETFVAITGMLNSPAVLDIVRSTFENPANGRHLLKLGMETVDRVQSPQLSQLLSGTLDRLLSSDQPEDLIDGLKGTYALKSPAHYAKAAELMKPGQQPDVLKQALRVLSLAKNTKPEVFLNLANDVTLDFDIRIEALSGLIQVDAEQARRVLNDITYHADTNQKTLLVNRLTQFPSGCNLALEQWMKRRMRLNVWSFSAAERAHLATRNDWRAQRVFREIQERETAAKAKIHKRIESYIAATRKLKGDPVAGQAVFGTCLTCHRVGNAGQDIAPALDGSANRELEHLITAIVDPDAAIEGGYGVFRVTKTDGSTLEGFLQKRDAQGTTIALMGGAKIFTARNEIKSQGFVGGRSFMPPAFSDLPDQTMVDLISYIKTLK